MEHASIFGFAKSWVS